MTAGGATDAQSRWIDLCLSVHLAEAGSAVPFDVSFHGQTCRGFAVRYQGRAYAYLNRCTHVPMELDWQPGQVFDDTGQWLVCATHGASYRPDTGACAGGPCRGGLVPIELRESAGLVQWHSRPGLVAVVF